MFDDWQNAVGLYDSDSDSPIESLPGTPPETRTSSSNKAIPKQEVNLNSQEPDVAGSEIVQKQVATLLEQDKDKSSSDHVLDVATDERSRNTEEPVTSNDNVSGPDLDQQHLQAALENRLKNPEENEDGEESSGPRKLSTISYVDPSDLVNQVTRGLERYDKAAEVAFNESKADLISNSSVSDKTPECMKKLYRHWKFVVGGIIALFVVATAVTVPTVLLLGKDEQVSLPEGETTWIPCPSKTGVPEQDDCEKKGCIWRASSTPWPSCYIPMDKVQYKVSDGGNSVWKANKQILVHLQRHDTVVNLFGSPSTIVTLQIDCTHSYRVRVKVYADKILPDPGTWTVKNDNNEFDCESGEYVIDTATAPGDNFKLGLERKSGDINIWNCSLGGLLVEDGFLQVANILPTTHVYGMAENWHSLSLSRDRDIRTWPLFSRSHAHDTVKAKDRTNLNSVHPFYLNLEEDGRANGVLFKTNFPSEYIILRAPGIVFRTIGRSLEFDIFVGQSPKHVSQLLREVIGGFQLPPMWALGFHIAPQGFPDQIIDVFRKTNTALDAVHLNPSLWTNNMIFESSKIINSTFFKYIKDHDEINWVLTTSPSVHASTEYSAYSLGLQKSAFIHWPGDLQQLPSGMERPQYGNGKPYHVMFGKRTEVAIVAFLDFQNDKSDFLSNLLHQFSTSAFNYNGIYVTDNEPFNFGTNMDMTSYTLRCPDNSSDSPTYPTAAAWSHGEGGKLSDGTLCMVGQHITNTGSRLSHLEIHNSYGMDMALQSYDICSVDERCFVMSDSTTYLSNRQTPSGTICKHLHYTDFSWDGLKRVLISVLELNLLGMPLVAVDVCKNATLTDMDLCGHWLQLSTFFPVTRATFSMSENQGTTEGVLHPTLLEKWTKPALQLRLSLLPYTYSALYMAQTTGEALLKPLFYEFPSDKQVREIYTQFMYGPSMMVAPILDERSHENGSLEVYFPDGNWYRIKADSGERIPNKIGYQTVHGVDHIPIFVRAGHIIPFQHSEESPNVESALNNSLMLGVFPQEGKAKGYLYVDDGKLDSKKTENHFHFQYDQCELRIRRDKPFNDTFPRQLILSRIIIYDWEMYDDRMYSKMKPQKAPGTQSRQEFHCYPSHDHKILILDMDIDLTKDVDNNLWILDWSMFKICSHLRSETGCYYKHYYNYQDTT